MHRILDSRLFDSQRQESWFRVAAQFICSPLAKDEYRAKCVAIEETIMLSSSFSAGVAYMLLFVHTDEALAKLSYIAAAVAISVTFDAIVALVTLLRCEKCLLSVYDAMLENVVHTSKRKAFFWMSAIGTETSAILFFILMRTERLGVTPLAPSSSASSSFL